jgi:hypothetical protein
VNRAYTWWCNKRPGNPCVFNCPNQVSWEGGGGGRGVGGGGWGLGV